MGEKREKETKRGDPFNGIRMSQVMLAFTPPSKADMGGRQEECLGQMKLFLNHPLYLPLSISHPPPSTSPLPRSPFPWTW